MTAKVDGYIAHAFWATIAGLTALAVSTMRDISKDLGDLNTKMAVIVERFDNYDQRLRRIEEFLPFGDKRD